MDKNEFMKRDPQETEPEDVSDDETNEAITELEQQEKKNGKAGRGVKAGKKAKEEKTVIMDFPMITSLSNRMKHDGVDIILAHLNDLLSEHSMSACLHTPVLTDELTEKDVEMGDITFWRVAHDALLADINLNVRLTTIEETGDVTGFNRLTLTLWCEACEDFYGDYYALNYTIDHSSRDLLKLDSYLRPFLNKRNIEEKAEDQWQNICIDAFSDPKKRKAGLMAEKYGLKIKRLPLYGCRDQEYIIYFESAKVEVQAPPVKGSKKLPPPRIEDVEGMTIVLNTNSKKHTDEDLRIFQACFEFEWYYLFYRLNGCQNTDKRQFSTYKRKCTPRQDGEDSNPLLWIPRMCACGGLALMMPLSVMKTKVHREFEIAGTERMTSSGYMNHAGFRLQKTIFKIAKEFEIKPYLVRRRIVNMGMVEAKGACNYDPERETYCLPYAFENPEHKKDIEYSIRRRDFYKLYCQDENLREMMHSGELAYVEGLVSLNATQYIQIKNGVSVPTMSANHRINASCLRFKRTFTDDDQTNTVDQEIFTESETYGFFDNYEKLKKFNGRRKEEIIRELPESFKETLSFLMKQFKINEDQLVSRSTLSAQTVRGYLTGMCPMRTQEEIIFLCTAMRLPGWLTELVLDKADLPIDMNDKSNKKARFVMDCLYLDHGNTIRKFMSYGFKEETEEKTNQQGDTWDEEEREALSA